jgi:hypothetical protein
VSRERFRLDLDGVDLKDPKGRVVCILRWRTLQGLVLRLPESTDVIVPWRLIESASLDLSEGAVRVRFVPTAGSELSWLKPWSELQGEWTDLRRLEAPPK